MISIQQNDDLNQYLVNKKAGRRTEHSSDVQRRLIFCGGDGSSLYAPQTLRLCDLFIQYLPHHIVDVTENQNVFAVHQAIDGSACLCA